MNTELKRVKATIRNFMRDCYSDEKLCQLLAHAQSGLLSYQSCCCFVGILNADHALKGYSTTALTIDSHYARLRNSSGTRIRTRILDAEEAYRDLACTGKFWTVPESEALRRRLIIPMVRAELRRRERLATPTQEIALAASAAA